MCGSPIVGEEVRSGQQGMCRSPIVGEEEWAAGHVWIPNRRGGGERAAGYAWVVNGDTVRLAHSFLEGCL